MEFARFRSKSCKRLAILRARARRCCRSKSGCDSLRWPTRRRLPMPPKKPAPGRNGPFRSLADNMIDMEHALLKSAGLIDWSQFDEAYGRFCHEKGQPGLSSRLAARLRGTSALPGEAICDTFMVPLEVSGRGVEPPMQRAAFPSLMGERSTRL